METVNIKFENFKSFLEKIPGVNPMYVSMLKVCNLDTFFLTLNQHKGLKACEIMVLIANKAELNIDNIETDVKKRFERYIEYFQEIKDTINM